jgi:hypothetical protein
MAKYSMAIECANFNNKINKESFLSYAWAYFHEGLSQDGPRAEYVTWTDLFHEYLRMEQKYPHNAHKPLNELVMELYNKGCFNMVFQEPEIFNLYKNAISFVQDIGVATYIEEQELDCPKDMYFKFTTPVPGHKNLRAGYLGHLVKYDRAIPKYGELFIESNRPKVGDFWKGDLDSPSDYPFIMTQTITNPETGKETVSMDRMFSINIVRSLPKEFSK